MVDKTLREAFQFHLENGGYCTPPGRAACALESARSEVRLQDAIEDERATVEWHMDEDYALGEIHGMTAEQERAKLESGEWEGPYYCVVKYGSNEASLGGIVHAWNDGYKRVIEAQLAREVLPDTRVGLMRFGRMVVDNAR